MTSRSFIPIPTVIDSVSVTSLWRQDQLVYAQPWKLSESEYGEVDPKSIGIFHIGNKQPIRAFMSLTDISRTPGFVIVDVKWSNEQVEAKQIALNVFNIKTIRPWIRRSRLDHYVVFIEWLYGSYQQLHISEVQEKKIQEAIQGL